MGFSRQEYWSGLPFPSPGDLPKPGVQPGSPALQADALPSEPQGEQYMQLQNMLSYYKVLYICSVNDKTYIFENNFMILGSFMA